MLLRPSTAARLHETSAPRRLPEDERVELAHELLRLIPADEPEREWLEEITWRADRVLRGESSGRPVDDEELATIF